MTHSAGWKAWKFKIGGHTTIRWPSEKWFFTAGGRKALLVKLNDNLLVIFRLLTIDRSIY